MSARKIFFLLLLFLVPVLVCAQVNDIRRPKRTKTQTTAQPKTTTTTQPTQKGRGAKQSSPKTTGIRKPAKTVGTKSADVKPSAKKPVDAPVVETFSPSLKGLRKVNYKFDFSNMLIEGKSARQFIAELAAKEGTDAESAYATFKKDVENIFITTVRTESQMAGTFSLDNSKKERLEVVIRISDVDEDGAHRIVGTLNDNKSKQVLGEVKARSRGGKNNFREQFPKRLKKSSKDFGDDLKELLDEKTN